MTKKSILLTILLNINLYGVMGVGDIVSDPSSYAYYVEQIEQMSKTMDLITSQIKTLGGIRTAVDDTKRTIYNAKDNLENVMGNLKNSMKNLTDAMSNVEVKSLWSLKRSSIGSGSGGLFSGDISKQIELYFKMADDEIIERMGGREKLKELEIELQTLNQALAQTNLNDFQTVMDMKVNTKKINEGLLVTEYLQDIKNQTREDVQQNAFANIQENYNEFFNPTHDQKSKRMENLKRLESFTKYIETSDDFMQQTQTTNLILVEILNILNREYKSALKYRNAIATIHLKNINNPAYLAQLIDNQEKMQEDIKSISFKQDTQKHEKIQKADPYGVGLRF